MAERLRGSPWVSVAAAALIVVAVVVAYRVLWGSQPSAASGALSGDGVAAVESRVADRLQPVRVRLVRTVRIRAGTVAWQDGSGAPMLQVKRMAFNVQAAAGGEILVSDGVIDSPEIHLVKSAAGWNYQQTLGPLMNRSKENRGAATTVTLSNFQIRGGTVTLKMPSSEYRASNLEVSVASARLSGPDVAHPEFRIASAEAQVELPDSTGGMVERHVALQDADLELPGGGLRFDITSVQFGSSTFADASGLWSPSLGGMGVRASLAVTDLQLAELPWLKAEVPEGAHGSAHVAVRPLGAERTGITLTGLDLTAPRSHVSGSLQAVLGPDGPTLESIDVRVNPLRLSLVEAFTGPLPYTGELNGRIHGTGEQVAFELQAQLAQPTSGRPFSTHLTGSVSLAGGKLHLGQVTAELQEVPLSVVRQFAPALPLAGAVSGTVRFQGTPGDSPLQVDVRLETGGGVLTVAGVVNLQDSVPTYDLHGRIAGVELRQVLAPSAPPAAVHATFQLAGSGLEPAIADATVALNGTFTGWRSQPGDTIALDGSADHGLLRARTARMDLGPIHLAASGEWRFANGSGGALSYDIAVASLQPLAPYFPADSATGIQPFVTGALSATGTIQGTLQSPSVRGTMSAQDFRYGAWAAASFSGSYDVRPDTALPDVVAKVQGTNIRTPGGDFDRASLDVDFTEPTFEVALDADQTGGGGVVQFQASGRMDDTGAREILVRQAELDLEGQRWHLPGPATIAWRKGEAVHVQDLGFEQVGGQGVARIDGVLAPADETDFDLDIRRLPIGEVLAFAGSSLPVTGLLDLQGSVRGPAAQPTVSLQLRLDGGSLRGVPVQAITGKLGYSDARLTFEATGQLGDSARVQITAAAGADMTLGLPPSFALVDDAPVEGHLTTQRFPLATLDPGIRTITDIAGDLSADMTLGGTPASPQVGGSVTIQNGAATVPMLDKRYHDLSGRATLDGRVVTLHDLSVTSGGTAVASGRITLEELTDPALEISVDLNGFQPQGVSGENDAGVWGNVALTGSFGQPSITGDVAVRDGAVSLAPVEQAGFGQRLIGASQQFDLLQGGLQMAEPAAAGGFAIHDLQVTVGDNLWFVMKEGRAQLAGRLTVNKTGGDFAIQGRLTGDQGTFTVVAGPGITRQFQLVDATVRFFGDPSPNPALDITASRTVRTGPNTRVDVRIRVTGTIDNLNVNLASANGSAVPQSELLCFLAVGRSCTEVANVGGQSLLGEAAALYGFTDLVASRIGPELGLDYFEIQTRPGASLDQLYLVAGKELPGLQDFWVNVESPLGGNDIAAYSTVSLEWHFNPSGTLEASYAPPETLRNITTGRAVPAEYLLDSRQLFIATRWRWTY